jgi:hypothetical protein
MVDKAPIGGKAARLEGLAATNSSSKLRRVIEFRAGYTAEATPGAIAFLWSNWEVLFRLAPGPLKVERLAPSAWRGSGYGGTGEWYLLKAEYGLDRGRFEFFSWVRFLGTVSRGTSVFEYRKADDAIAYWGRAWGELPLLLWPFQGLVGGLGQSATLRLNAVGGQVAAAITQNPELVRDCADPDVYQSWQALQVEEAEIRAGKCKHPKFFMRDATLEAPSRPVHLSALRDELRHLGLSMANGSGDLEISEYSKALAGFEIDPRMGLAKIREVLEPLVCRIYRIAFGSNPGSHEILSQQIKRIERDAAGVPVIVTTLMKMIVDLGNLGVHRGRSGKAEDIIDFAEFRTGFDALLAISRWYAATHPESYQGVLALGSPDPAVYNVGHAPDSLSVGCL